MNTPTVALTFDDGPSEWTEPLLDLLAERLSRGTFFVLGCNIAGRENILRRMAAEGHEIGVHGWDHTPLPSLTREQLCDQLVRTADAIALSAGVDARWWRPPWNHAPAAYQQAALDAGYRQVGVSVDGHDVSTSEGAIVRHVVAGLADRAIVGLHDGIAPNGEQHVQTREPTVRAVAQILNRCMSVTVSELLA